MKTLGATCETCKFLDGEDKHACRKCMTKDGHPGWEPAEGVKVQHSIELISKRPVRRVVM